MERVKTPADVKNDTTLYYDHTAWARGYTSRKSDGWVEEYDGAFGKGYKVHRPSWKSTYYHEVDYYISR